MAEESAYLGALHRAATYSISNGRLTLKGKSGFALLSFVVQQQSLAGTRWIVTGYNNGKQAVVSVMASTKLTANFGKDDIEGFAGCNHYGGKVAVTPPKIAITAVNSTNKECASPAGVMDQELGFLAALQKAATFQLQGATLELRTASNAIAVTMQRA
jgi:heat shock protein HslJ